MMTGRSEGELFKKILGEEWFTLHRDIQARFEKNPALSKPLYYTGYLSQLTSSVFGKILGCLSFPFLQGALIPLDDFDFPVDIKVYSKPNDLSIYKQRIYHLHGRKPIQFTSYMRESEKGDVLEYVGMGLGMKLILSVQNGNLHFLSDGYFWEVLGKRIWLPDFLTPGTVYLSHCNDHPAQFNIRIEIKHSLFGTSFTQIGVFHEIAGQSLE